jgi:hypothetical protein
MASSGQERPWDSGQIRCGSLFLSILFFVAFYAGIFEQSPVGLAPPASATAGAAQQQSWRSPISNSTARAHARQIRADLRRAKKAGLRGKARAPSPS